MEEIQKDSWGFFKNPLENDMILIAEKDGENAGMAYLNSINFNVDYGVHVKKNFWRMGVGKAIMDTALGCARKESPFLSVIRVFRSLNGTSADRRAVAFYSACNPSLKLAVYSLK